MKKLSVLVSFLLTALTAMAQSTYPITADTVRIQTPPVRAGNNVYFELWGTMYLRSVPTGSTANSLLVYDTVSRQVKRLTLNPVNWDSSYQQVVTGMSFSGGTLTLTKRNGSVLSQSLDGRYALLSHTHAFSDLPGLVDSMLNKVSRNGSYTNPSWLILTKSFVGLGNVDNTSDANKPISTAQQTALNGKLNVSDTASMLDPYALADQVISSVSLVANDGLSVSGSPGSNITIDVKDLVATSISSVGDITTAGTVLANAISSTGGNLNLTGSPNVIASGTLVANNIFSYNDLIGSNIIANAITGTLATPAQPNVTLLGTLQVLSVNGRIRIITNSELAAEILSGNATALYLKNASGTEPTLIVTSGSGGPIMLLRNPANQTVGSVTATGDLSINSIQTVVGTAIGGSLTVTGGISATLSTAIQPNITLLGTLAHLTVIGNTTIGGNLAISVINGVAVTASSHFGTAGDFTNNTSGHPTVKITNTTGGPILSLVGNAGLAAGGMSGDGTLTAIDLAISDEATVAGRLTAGSLSITGSGIFQSLTVTGITRTTGLTVSGNADITGSLNVSGSIAGTLTTAAQPNITSIGTLSGLTVTNAIHAANITSTGIVTAAVISAGTLSAVITTAKQPNITQLGTLTALTINGPMHTKAIDLQYGAFSSGASLTFDAVSWVNSSVGANTCYLPSAASHNRMLIIRFGDPAGSANSLTINAIGGEMIIAGTNVAGSYILGEGEVIMLQSDGSNWISNTKYSEGTVSGTITTAAQPNVTSLGNLTGLTVTGDLYASGLTNTVDTANYKPIVVNSSGRVKKFPYWPGAGGSSSMYKDTVIGGDYVTLLNTRTSPVGSNGSRIAMFGTPISSANLYNWFDGNINLAKVMINAASFDEGTGLLALGVDGVPEIRFSADGSSALIDNINPSGTNDIKVGSFGTTSALDIQTTNGIKLPTGGSFLKHYEENISFTPGLNGISADTAIGRYTRIGKQVTVTVVIATTTTANASEFRLTGFPYAFSSTFGLEGSVPIRSGTGANVYGDLMGVGGQTYAVIRNNASNRAISPLTNTQVFGSSGAKPIMRFTMTYMID